MHKHIFLASFLFILFVISGCDSVDLALDTDNSEVNIPLKWQQPTHRVNGAEIQKDEKFTYEIWAGYSADSLFWIYTYTDFIEHDENIEVNLANILKENGSTEQLSTQTLYIGIIAIDEDNNRSVMSDLKLLEVNI